MIKHDKTRPCLKNETAFGPVTRGAMAASVAGLVFLASPAHQAVAADNPFVQQFGKDNPLRAPIGVANYAKPAFVDIDNDGDLDLFIGDAEGAIAYFENIGDAASPEFMKRTGTANPFGGVDVGYNAAPAFADIDNDGDMDALVGENGWTEEGGIDDDPLSYFENTGTASVPEFTLRATASNNPFYQFMLGYYDVTPAFADVDSDGDIDVVVGESNSSSGYGSLHYFENVTTETDTAPVFNVYYQNYTDNPFYGLMTDSSSYTTPAAFADIDNDGDLDLFGGEGNGSIYFLENMGEAPLPEGPVFTQHNRYDTDNPFYDIYIANRPAPVFADLDNDGDLDAIIGTGEGNLVFFENFGDNTAPVFGKRVGDNSPFTGFDIGWSSRPVFVDIDGDGDMDMVSGGELNYSDLGEALIDEIGNRLDFFENVGTKWAPVFEERLGADSPLNGIVSGHDDIAAFVDIDGDRDMDLFTKGKYDDTVAFYRNVGNTRNPAFEKQPDGENPLFFVDSWGTSSLQFVDIDGDGDMDAFIEGNDYSPGYGLTSIIGFYENVGTATSPIFTPAGDNPLDMVLAGVMGFPYYTDAFSLAFVDIDGDGDMDAIVGEEYYDNENEEWVHGLRLYENTGSATEPAFVPVEDADTFFTEMAEQGETYYDMFPAFVDIDADGDIDAFVGEDYGRFLFFENTTNEPGPGPAPGPVLPESDEGGCFIDTAGGAQGNLFSRALTWIHSTVTAMLK